MKALTAAVLVVVSISLASVASADIWYDCEGPGSMQDTPCTEEQGESWD